MANMSGTNGTNGTNGKEHNAELLAAFRQKAAFMKSWKPASTPSSRDRLELYAWNKQAISGDAPSSLTGTSLSAAETSKYNAWRAKAGTDTVTAMAHYMSEAERQVRVYGCTPANGNATIGNSHAGSSSNQNTQPNTNAQHSRGLAAIPLLCAAASEQRTAYIRRLQISTHSPTGRWWKRQEPLASPPGSLVALPETILLGVASVVEHISLTVNADSSFALPLVGPLPAPASAVIQSFLWPLHNCLLAVWMGIIVVTSASGAVFALAKTILLGGRHTGRTLQSIWEDDVVFCHTAVQTLTASHQPVAARVLGLVLQPLAVMVAMSPSVSSSVLVTATVFSSVFLLAWWYWWCVLPWFAVVIMLGTALVLGHCFALIELASQI